MRHGRLSISILTAFLTAIALSISGIGFALDTHYKTHHVYKVSVFNFSAIHLDALQSPLWTKYKKKRKKSRVHRQKTKNGSPRFMQQIENKWDGDDGSVIPPLNIHGGNIGSPDKYVGRFYDDV